MKNTPNTSSTLHQLSRAERIKKAIKGDNLFDFALSIFIFTLIGIAGLLALLLLAAVLVSATIVLPPKETLGILVLIIAFLAAAWLGIQIKLLGE